MPAGNFDVKELERRMRGAMDTLKKEFAGLRTGRASTHLLDPVVVNVYGQRMPINQVATVSTPDARTISVQVWDKGQVSAVERAIREANLGLNPVTDGALIRLPIPALNAERRQWAIEVAHLSILQIPLGFAVSNRNQQHPGSPVTFPSSVSIFVERT